MTLKLPSHGRYDYSPITERKDYDWPGGKRLAFCLTANIAVHAFMRGRGHDNATHCLANPHADRLWKCRPGDIADHCTRLAPGIVAGS